MFLTYSTYPRKWDHILRSNVKNLRGNSHLLEFSFARECTVTLTLTLTSWLKELKSECASTVCFGFVGMDPFQDLPAAVIARDPT